MRPRLRFWVGLWISLFVIGFLALVIQELVGGGVSGEIAGNRGVKDPTSNYVNGSYALQDEPTISSVTDLVAPNTGISVAAVRWLDSQHVIVVLDTQEARELFLNHKDPERPQWQRQWLASQAAGAPNWQMRDKLLASNNQWAKDARRAAGEGFLAEVTDWKVVSAGAKIEHSSHIDAVDAMWVGVDGADEGMGLGIIRYGVYVYISFSAPCERDVVYSLKNDRFHIAQSVTFTADETTSWAIKVNQVGFRISDSDKYGYVGSWIPGGKAVRYDGKIFDLINQANKKVVYSGTLKLRDEKSRCAVKRDAPAGSVGSLITGEWVYEADFSEFSLPGTYVLRVTDVGCSWPFVISDQAYEQPFTIAARGLFHQRASFALSKPFTQWERPRFHTKPIVQGNYVPFGSGYVPWPKDYDRFDVIGAERIDRTGGKAVAGGWYDAADYDRNISHYTNILDILWMYERRPMAFSDGQLSLPESGNGIPDILDEVSFGLEVWMQGQLESGGVPGMVETNTHPSIDNDSVIWAYSRATPWSSLLFSGSAAKLSRLVRPFNAQRADRYLQSALAAYAYAINPENGISTVQVSAAKQRGKGTPYQFTWESDENSYAPFRVFAATQLAITQQSSDYNQEIESFLHLSKPPYEWPCTYRDYSPFLFVDVLRADMPSGVSSEARQTITDWLVKPAIALLRHTDSQPYRHTWPRDQDYWIGWGESIMANRNRALFIAQFCDPSLPIYPAVLANMAHDFGANPLGMCWTTGVGSVYPAVFQHEWSQRDQINDPIPGLTIYGVTDGGFRRFAEDIWQHGSSQQGYGPLGSWSDVPLWRRWSAHPTLNTGQCEFTIHETCSATILSCGMLLPEKASGQPAQIPGPKPLSDLNGYWYVP